MDRQNFFIQFKRTNYFYFFMGLCFSAPKTPIEDSVVGFQVDKLANAIRGESRIKITVYEHDQGQVSGNAYFY